MNALKAGKQLLTAHDERVHSILSRVGEECLDAADFLADYNASPYLAQKVSEMLNAPLTFLQVQHLASCERIAKIMREVVVGHVREVAAEATVTGLWEVVPRGEDVTMEYVVALQDYTLENRSLLRGFKTDYHCTRLAEIVPLVFHLIPQKRASNVINANPIEL